MENLNKDEFKNLQELTSVELEMYAPDLLEGLWELGSMPEYIISLIRWNIEIEGARVIDLGCGKGSVLITLARRFDIKGIGIDKVPEFIEQAKGLAKKHGVSEHLVFKAGDLVKVMQEITAADIAIYRYGSKTLGELKGTIKEISKSLKDDGFIIIEFMITNTSENGVLTEMEMITGIDQAGYAISDRINWDRDTLKLTNKLNTNMVRANVNRLTAKYPDKKQVFEEYMERQIEKCNELERGHTRSTLLIRKKEYCIHPFL